MQLNVNSYSMIYYFHDFTLFNFTKLITIDKIIRTIKYILF